MLCTTTLCTYSHIPYVPALVHAPDGGVGCPRPSGCTCTMLKKRANKNYRTKKKKKKSCWSGWLLDFLWV